MLREVSRGPPWASEHVSVSVAMTIQAMSMAVAPRAQPEANETYVIVEANGSNIITAVINTRNRRKNLHRGSSH